MVLNTFNSPVMPILLNLKGTKSRITKDEQCLKICIGQLTDTKFEFGEYTEAYRSCGAEYQGEYYIFGGYQEKRQARFISYSM